MQSHTHTQTHYQHTASHANTCIVLIKGWCVPAGSVRARVWKPANQLSPEVISKKLKSVVLNWSVVEMALRAWEGYVRKLLWERHGYWFITTERQTGRRTESDSPSEKWQEAKGEKAKFQSDKEEKKRIDLRGRGKRGHIRRRKEKS